MARRTLQLLLLTIGATIDAAILPPYIKPCFRKDPNFNTCALQHGQEVLPILAKGDRKLGLMQLDPLEVLELKIDNKGLILSLQNITQTGLGNAQLENVNFDFDKKKLFFTYNAPKLILLGKYSISGRILVLPINGKGDINTTLIEPKLVNEVNLTFHEKDGEEFMALDKNLKVTTTVKRVYMHLTNLFNGNELLGREMNNFLNENWKEVSDEVMQPVIDTISITITENLNSVLESIPMDVLFPTK